MNFETFRTEFFEGTRRYRWLQTLGRGAMGVVFKAHDLELDEIVAIKALYSDIGEDEEATRARFKREINLNRRIKHPNVARMYDFGTSHGHPFITMEFVPGQTLQHLVEAEGRLVPRRAVHVLKQIASGTHAAHLQGIIHRDLKSQNIIVGEADTVSILDFGLAKTSTKEKLSLTLDAVVLGTPHYISPEQAMGQAADVRSDIYSMGIIAFETLSGTLPFTADTVLAIAMKHVSEQVPGDLERYPDISPALRSVVLKALEKEPDERWQSALEFEKALSDAEANPQAEGEAPQRGAAPPPEPRPEVWLGFEEGPAASPATGPESVTPRVPYRRRPRTVAPPPEAGALPPPPGPPPPAVAPVTEPSQRKGQVGIPTAQTERPGRKGSGSLAVLLVGTDGAERISNASELQKQGLRAIEARSAEEALEILLRVAVDCVVTEISLPGMDGFDLVRILRNQPQFGDLPIALLTGKLTRSQESTAANLSIGPILVRPVPPSQVAAKVIGLLEEIGARRRDAGRPGGAPGGGSPAGL